MILKPAWWLVLIVSLVGPIGWAATEPGPSGLPVAMTLDVAWVSMISARPSATSSMTEVVSVPKLGVDLALSAGRVVEATAWPLDPHEPGQVLFPPRNQIDGSWLLGTTGRGKVRIRVEAPLAADLTVRVGGEVVRIGLASLLEGPQKGSTPGRQPTEITVERLPWDAIQVDLGASDGTADPASVVPLNLQFNILTPEPAEVNLHSIAQIRPLGGAEPVWRREWREVVATNNPASPPHPLNLTMPGPEGTYLLEVKTDWEPLGDPAGTRLGRWVRRRRNPSQITSASRRMTLAVVHAQAPAPVPLTKADGSGIDVDLIDLTRPTGHRASASGQAPGHEGGGWSWLVPDAALLVPPLRDRLRGWIGRTGGELAVLPAANTAGMAWSAVGLKVPHPDRPHRLTLTVTGGHPAALGVALIANGVGTNPKNRVVLDACVAGPPILEGSAPITFSWPVWPGVDAPVVVLANRGSSAPVQVGAITLTELGDLPPAIIQRQIGRSLGLHLAHIREFDRFGGVDPNGRVDPLTQARNLTTYLIHTGASSVVLPDGLSDRAARRGLAGQADEDSTGPDRLDLLLRVLARRNRSAWVDVAFNGSIAGLPGLDSPEAASDGLLRLDRQGKSDGLAYQPIHPTVRAAMARRVADAVKIRQTRPNLIGALVRLGPGSTLPGGPDSGLDDVTYARFVAATFEPGPAARIPGRNAADPHRFEARARFVDVTGRGPWLTWRAREVASLYASLADAARRAAPGSILAVATPGLDAGPAGDEARRVDLDTLGPGKAWPGVGLDLSEWKTGEGAPVILRATGLSTDDLAHDLAISPELDRLVAARPERGSLVGVEDVGSAGTGLRLTARPMAEGAAGDEPLEHALGAIDASWIFVAAASASGQEERLRRFTRVFAALPASPRGVAEPRLASGVVARPIRSGSDSFLAMANDSPYPILLEATFATAGQPTVDDLGRGIRLEPDRGPNSTRLVIELPPFGVAATRLGTPDIRLASVTPYPGPAVLDGMKAQYEDLATTLDRLKRLQAGGSRGTGPTNAGFESNLVLTAINPASSGPGVVGWDLVGGPGLSGLELDRDRPHSGRESLRLDAQSGPAGIESAPFHPEARTNLVVRGWLRADQPDARVRVRVEGQTPHRGYLRQFDVLVPGDWTRVEVRAPGLPDGGLDTARVRFELLAPGRLWVDDVAVTGDILGESELVNAKRDMMGAIEAYRERRYGEFARLAGSSATRHVAGAASAAVIAGDRSGLIRTGDASALPSERRKR